MKTMNRNLKVTLTASRSIPNDMALYGATEVIDYAEWLGMDIEADEDLLWIAREGLKAPLPEHWKPWCVIMCDMCSSYFVESTARRKKVKSIISTLPLVKVCGIIQAMNTTRPCLTRRGRRNPPAWYCLSLKLILCNHL